MGRTPCCEKNGLKRGPWTQEEDQKLIDYIHKHGYSNWRLLPKNAGIYTKIVNVISSTTFSALELTYLVNFV